MNTAMYSLLSKESLEFVRLNASTSVSRKPQASLALARVLAYRLDLPSAPVEDIEHYYRDQCELEVMGFINTCNELLIMNMQSVLDYTYSLYLARYYVCHAITTISAFSTETACEDFFSISRGVSRDTMRLIKEAPAEISALVVKFSFLVEDLSKQKLGV